MPQPNKFWVLGIDPGKLTGICLYCYENSTATRVWAQEVNEIDVDFLIEDTISAYAPNIVIINEKFFITQRTYKLPDCPWSLEKTGVIKYMCNKYNVKYHWQSPTDAKEFAPDSRLRELDEWYKGGDGHARDAIRHAITFMVKMYRWNPDGLLVEDEEDESIKE